MEGFCFQCRRNKEMKGAQAVTLRNGAQATMGKCPDCGMKMCRIGQNRPKEPVQEASHAQGG